MLRGTKWAFKLQGPESSVAGGQAALMFLGWGGTRSFTGVARLTVHPRLWEGLGLGGSVGQLEQQALGRWGKSFLSLLGPPQVSASTQRDGGAKRHQFTNKGATSPTTKETYVIELTPEPQLTLTCQPPLISFVNSLCCLPNWGPVTCGLCVYKGKCLDSLPKQTFTFNLIHRFIRPENKTYAWKPSHKQLPNYKWILLTQYGQIDFSLQPKPYSPASRFFAAELSVLL